MDLFGKKAMSDLQSRCDKALAACRDASAALDEERRRHEASRSDLEKARNECQALTEKLAKVEKDRDRAVESLARAEKMVRWMEDRESENAAAVRKAEAASTEALRKATERSAEVERLQAEIDAARSPEEVKPPPPEAPKDEATAAQASGEEVDRLRNENEALRRNRAEGAERLRVALRKAEHNRRAYLITQMQLDLAEDRIHILTKGKPRPVHRPNPEPVQDAGEKVVAEEVEGFEDTGSTGG